MKNTSSSRMIRNEKESRQNDEIAAVDPITYEEFSDSFTTSTIIAENDEVLLLDQGEYNENQTSFADLHRFFSAMRYP